MSHFIGHFIEKRCPSKKKLFKFDTKDNLQLFVSGFETFLVESELQSVILDFTGHNSFTQRDQKL